MGRLDGKVALVTGAARGQGRSHALTLAKEGADILALDVEADIEGIPYGLATADELNQLCTDVEALNRRVIAVHGDVRHQADIDRLVDRGLTDFGRVDIVVANAGVWNVGNLWEFTEDDWSTVVDINLAGVWRTVKAVAPHMIEQERGSIILISSVQGYEGGAGLSQYIAAKHGVLGFMKAAAIELGEFNVRCNAVCPGIIDTPIVNWQGALDSVAGPGPGGHGTRKDLEDNVYEYTLLKGRSLLSPQATSNAVLWLASDESSEVTGLELVVDAGHSLMPGMNPARVYEHAYRKASS